MRWSVWCVAVVAALAVLGCKMRAQTGPEVATPAFVILDPGQLARGKARAAAGESTKAMSSLVTGCNWAMEQPPRTVVFGEKETPSSDPHDYVSLQTYLWPNPQTPDGQPWIVKDGEVFPGAATPDKQALDFVCTQARLLALGYAATGNQAYADRAAKLLRVFFLDPATRMNPNMTHAQMATGRNTGSPSGIIDSRMLLRIVDVPALLAGSKALTPAETAGLRQWCAQYLDWLLTSRNGIQEGQARNNHGTWYDAQVVGLALFAGRADTARTQLARATARLYAQIDVEGLQPEEIRRTKSLNYHLFNLEGWFTLALMAEKAGVDLWTLTTASGRSLRQALDALRPFLRGDKPWPHQQIRELHAGDLRQAAFLLRLGGLKYGDDSYEKDLDHVLGSLAPGLELNLTFPPSSGQR